MPEIWKPHVVTATVVERDGRYLIVEEMIEGRRVFNQPAGHLDPGETLLDCARRETLEETGWTVRIDSLLGVYLMETEVPGKTFVRFCFAATAEAHDPARPLDTEIIRTHWFERGEVEARADSLRSPLVLEAIDTYEQGARHPLELLHATLRG
ncbi:MAG: NUDIX hydrolase [Gammaproteobacteria bacterium]